MEIRTKYMLILVGAMFAIFITIVPIILLIEIGLEYISGDKNE